MKMAKLVAIQCRMFSVLARIEGYKAEGYNDQSFYTLERELLELAEQAEELVEEQDDA